MCRSLPARFYAPQGFAEKIQFQFLLPYLAIELRNPLPRSQQLPASGHRARSILIFRRRLTRPSSSPLRQAGFTQRCITILPHIQPLPSNAELLRYCAYAFSCQHSAHRR
jgi:hypothetical protein